MRASIELHDQVASLLDYPACAGPENLSARARILAGVFPDAAEGLLRFARSTGELSAGELEELYTRTFDNVPERALEVGWQVFGESYARGAFLIAMRERLRSCCVAESAELPDHLTHVLRTLGRLPANTAAALVDGVIRNAVVKLNAGFEDREHPYLGAIEAVQSLLATHGIGATPAGIRREPVHE